MSDGDARQVRAGQMRAAVADVVRRSGSALRRASGPSLVGLLCAGALAPVVAAGAAAGPVLVAGMGVLGSVGANVLTDVVMKVIDGLRTEGKPPPQDAVERALATRIEAAFSDRSEHAPELRAEIAALLREIDGVGAALDAVERDDQELRAALVGAFQAVGTQFDEFAFVLADLRRALWAIEESVRRLEAQQRADRERSAEQGTALRQVLDKVTAVEARSRPAAGERTAEDRRWDGCPYRGLAPFEERHADVFYGRKDLTTKLVQQLAQRLTGTGMLVVFGPSGAGKSSLLRAGLVPRLAADLLVPGSAAWPRRVLTPTGRPLDELAVHLADLSGTDAGSVCRSLAQDPQQAPLLVRQALQADPRAMAGPSSDNGQVPARLVLIVDQFEELFTLVDEDDAAARAQRSAFIAALHAAATPQGGPDGNAPALVVVSVRGDFLDQAVAYPPVRDAVQAGPFLVGPMTEAELRQAISGPAAEAGVALESGLEDAIIDDLRDSPAAPDFTIGVLPLLSQAMLTTWEQREAGPLTLRAYRRAGGVSEAVQTSAEEVYEQLSPERQDTARAVLTQLTVVTVEGRLARRRATRAELRAATDSAEVDAILEVFAAKRLIVLHDETVEIAHDALLRAWSRLRGWLDADLADRALYHQLTTDAALWYSNQRDRSFLYRGTQLAAVEKAAGRWAATPDRYPLLTPEASNFLVASQRDSHRAARRRRAVVGAVASLAVLALVAAGIAVNNASDANRQHALALSRQLTAQSQAINSTEPLTARRLAAAASSLAPTDEARDSMTTLLAQQRGLLLGHTDYVLGVAFSPDSRLLATTSLDGTVRLWDPTTGRAVGNPLIGHTDAVYGVAFSPDSRLLATTSLDGTVRLWDPTTGRAVGNPLIGHTDAVYGVAFSPDSRLLATTGWDQTVRLWDPATGRTVGNPLTGHTGPAYGVAFSPDGRLLATTSNDGPVRLWDPATGREVGNPLTGHTGPVSGVAFSPDGRLLATTGYDQTVRSWDPATGRTVGNPLAGHTGPAYGVAFSPDGRLLATTDSDRSVRLWDPVTGRAVGSPLTGHDGAVFGVAFSPDGRLLATTSNDGPVRLGDPATGRTVGSLLTGNDGPVYGVAFSPDGRLLATTSNDGPVRVMEPGNRPDRRQPADRPHRHCVRGGIQS